MLYDVFISHAYEDKQDFVKPLADKLIECGIEVWYDEYSLSIGDSLRRSIDKGLKESTYGIIVLSKNFFNKNWSQYELDGLLQLQSISKSKRILPIWHNITKEEIINYAPSLADIIALSSNEDLENIVEKISKVIKPKGSSLIIARDTMIEYGAKPPVISDDWWLDVAISIENNGPFERWQFPIGYFDDTIPQERGYYLAWHAMQQAWVEKADTIPITQITHPEIVLDFIEKSPGLKEKCEQYPDFLLAYAPFIGIKGFEGPFFNSIENFYQASLIKQQQLIKEKSTYGSGLTTSNLPPECEEELALRHPQFGNYRPSTIACTFTQGQLMGLSPRYYTIIDYVVWLLSENSNWLPQHIRKFLLTGYKEWGMWAWNEFSGNDYIYFEDEYNSKYKGCLSEALYSHDKKKFIYSKKVIEDIKGRFNFSKQLLGIDDNVATLVEKFIEEKFVECFLEQHYTKLGKRRKHCKIK